MCCYPTGPWSHFETWEGRITLSMPQANNILFMIHGCFVKQSFKNFTRFLSPLNLKGGKKRRQLQISTTFIAWSWKIAASASHLFFRWLQRSGKKVGDFRCGIHSQNEFGCACALWRRKAVMPCPMAAGSQHRQKQMRRHDGRYLARLVGGNHLATLRKSNPLIHMTYSYCISCHTWSMPNPTFNSCTCFFLPAEIPNKQWRNSYLVFLDGA